MSGRETDNPGEDRGLLIVWHSRTGGAEAMAQAAREGAAREGAAMEGASAQDPVVDAVLLRATEVAPDHVLRAAAFLFVCPENLAAMSGEMKEFFDRCYYPLLGQIEGRPYATAIAAGSDGENATRQIDRIATGWRLRRVADPLICNFGAQSPEEIMAAKTLSPKDREACSDLGAALAAGLAMGVF